MTQSRFNAEYYSRYYENRSTTVVTKAAARAEVKFALAFCEHIGVEIRRFGADEAARGRGESAVELARRRYRPS